MPADLYFVSQHFPSIAASIPLRATLLATTQFSRSVRWRYNRVRLYSVAVNTLPASYGLSWPTVQDTNITQCTVCFE